MKLVALAVTIAGLALFACSSSKNHGNDGGGGSGGNPVPPLGDGGAVTYDCASEIHVAPNGDDSAAGTMAAPMKTIAKAAPKATAGTCIQVHAGTYAEATTISFNADGTQAMPIVLRSADGKGAAIIDSSGNGSGEAVLVRHDYVVVDGFTFANFPTGTSQQPVHFDGLNTGKCNGAVLRNSKITGGHNQLKINETATNVTVEYNEFYGGWASGGPALSLTSAPGLVFRQNYCHDWNSGDNGAVQLKGGSHDVLFDGNRFQNVTSAAGTIALGDGCDSTCDIDPDHYAAVRVHAINNVMVNVGRGFDIQACADCEVASNTIVASGAGNVIFKLTSATTNGTTKNTVNAKIEDNLIANPAGDLGSVMQVNAGSDSGMVSDYNLVWNMGHAVNWGDGHPSSADAHSVTVDPQFTNASGGDYSLVAGSAAIGGGTNLVNDVPHDILGNPRPSSGSFDIGAYQSR